MKRRAAPRVARKAAAGKAAAGKAGTSPRARKARKPRPALPQDVLLPPNGLLKDDGAALWDFLTTFLAARRSFLSIHRRYERRVITSARERGVSRHALELPPGELARLFSLRRLETLRDERLGPLKDLASKVFGTRSYDDLIDVYCTHLYHECSILAEEHRSVERFVRISDRRRYAQLFQEVSAFYPVRLRRMQRFFAAGLRRVETLLPGWAQLVVVVRSVYLFGDRLARSTWGEGVEAFYRRMYPKGGAPKGFLEAARSFAASGFRSHAREAATKAVAAATGPGRAPKGVREAAEAAQALLSELAG